MRVFPDEDLNLADQVDYLKELQQVHADRLRTDQQPAGGSQPAPRRQAMVVLSGWQPGGDDGGQKK